MTWWDGGEGEGMWRNVAAKISVERRCVRLPVCVCVCVCVCVSVCDAVLCAGTLHNLCGPVTHSESADGLTWYSTHDCIKCPFQGVGWERGSVQ